MKMEVCMKQWYAIKFCSQLKKNKCWYTANSVMVSSASAMQQFSIACQIFRIFAAVSEWPSNNMVWKISTLTPANLNCYCFFWFSELCSLQVCFPLCFIYSPPFSPIFHWLFYILFNILHYCLYYYEITIYYCCSYWL